MKFEEILPHARVHGWGRVLNDGSHLLDGDTDHPYISAEMALDDKWSLAEERHELLDRETVENYSLPASPEHYSFVDRLASGYLHLLDVAERAAKAERELPPRCKYVHDSERGWGACHTCAHLIPLRDALRKIGLLDD